MQKEDIKPYLIERLKQVNAFWSYNVDTIKDVPDSILVELVFLHLDLDDNHQGTELHPYPTKPASTTRVPRHEIWHLHPLGHLSHARTRGMGDAQPQHPLSRISQDSRRFLPFALQC